MSNWLVGFLTFVVLLQLVGIVFSVGSCSEVPAAKAQSMQEQRQTQALEAIARELRDMNHTLKQIKVDRR